MPTTGTLKLVKEQLRTIISGADTLLQPKDEHVLGKWRIDTWYLKEDKLPIVTLRIGPVTHLDPIYGRKITGSTQGQYASFFFTAHVWHSIADSEPEDQNATDIADIIIDKLEKYVGDETSGIVYFENITSRPLEPVTGPTIFCRIAIEGYIFVKRKFS